MLVVKNLPANAGDVRDVGSVPGLGRSPGGGHGPLYLLPTLICFTFDSYLPNLRKEKKKVLVFQKILRAISELKDIIPII